jgi:hypothetical protein
MNKKREEKIMEEVRQRVFQKDRELEERKEEKEIRESNIEVLAEMTSLSKSDVIKIEEQVRREYLQSLKLKNRNYIIYISAFILLSFILFFVFKKEKPPKEYTIEDTFDSNTHGWDIYDDYSYKRSMEAGAYIFETFTDGWCYWDDIPIKFPKNYSIEVVSQWKSGTFSSYGLSLLTDDYHYFAFYIRADRNASYGKVVNGKWIIDGSWQSEKAYGAENDYLNTQELKVRGDDFTYYVNGKYVLNGALDIPVNNIGLRCCGEQIVEFHSVKITDMDNNKVILNENFNPPTAEWNVRESINKTSEIKDGMYVFTADDGDNCFWGVSDEMQIDDNCEITLTSKWINGEKANYGLMLLIDNDNYVACQLNNFGQARIIISEDGAYTNIGDYEKTGFKSNGNNEQIIKAIIKDNTISYYVNDKFVQKRELPFTPQYCGLRVCGKQTVAYDNLKIKRYEK